MPNPEGPESSNFPEGAGTSPRSGLYPEESLKMDVLGHLEELRKRIFISMAVIACVCAALFAKGDALMRLARKPLGGDPGQLVFIGPTEAFLAYLKLTLLASLVLGFPVLLHQAWGFFSPAVPKHVRRNILVWLAAAFLLFYGGIAFSYFVFIPAALSFLIGFGKSVAAPMLTLDKYISFFTALTLMGGVIFEIPVVMALLAEVGMVKSELLRQNRRYAVALLFVAAAVITPTQDAVNMIIFCIPMYLLYESGIMFMKIIERKRESRLLNPGD